MASFVDHSLVESSSKMSCFVEVGDAGVFLPPVNVSSHGFTVLDHLSSLDIDIKNRHIRGRVGDVFLFGLLCNSFTIHVQEHL